MEILNEKVKAGKIKNQTLMFHGPVELRRGSISKRCHLYLYRDFLVVTNSQFKTTFKIKYIVPLTSLWIGDCVGQDIVGRRQAKKSIHLGWPMKNFIATFCSSNQKGQWSCFLQRCITQTKEKYQGMSTALEIFTEDYMDCSSPFTVTATHLDTVNDIIRKLQPLLGTHDAEADYQLCFSSGQEEAPCPLLGHENPYAIKMSELRNDAFMALGPSNYSAYLNIQKVIQELQDPHVPGRFILKPKEIPRDVQQSNSENTARRCSILNRLFGRGASKRPEYVCPDTPAPTTGHLYCNSLDAVFKDDSLRASILDILSLLKDKGPEVKGIFRTSANSTSCQTLKEKLDSRRSVNLKEESVHVLGSVLKDFLRNIPGGVFSSSLYDKWLAVIDRDTEKERICAIHSLLEQLPTPNAVLMRELFQVLHSIEKNSSTNYMTSYNLSVCIAPSVMCLPSSSKSGLGKEISKQISLVQFIIENFQKIFEDNINTLSDESNNSAESSENVEQPLDFRPINVTVSYRRNNCSMESEASSGPAHLDTCF